MNRKHDNAVPPGPLIGHIEDADGNVTDIANLERERFKAFATWCQDNPLGDFEAFAFQGLSDQRARILQAMRDAAYPQRSIERYESCCSQMFVYRNRTTQELRTCSNTCGQRWCPKCSRQYAIRIKARILRCVPQCLHQLRFVTLTLEQDPGRSLKSSTQLLRQSLRRLMQSPLWKRTVAAAVAVMEVTPSKTHADAWHVHYHLAADAKYIRAADLKHHWRLATRDRGHIVDIRLAYDAGGLGRYLAGYLSKGIDERIIGNPGKLAEYLRVFRRLHRLTFHGNWFGQGIARKVGHACSGKVKQGHDQDWEFIGTLEIIQSRARHGEATAVRILHELGLPATVQFSPTPTARPPPQPLLWSAA